MKSKKLNEIKGFISEFNSKIDRLIDNKSNSFKFELDQSDINQITILKMDRNWYIHAYNDQLVLELKALNAIDIKDLTLLELDAISNNKIELKNEIYNSKTALELENEYITEKFNEVKSDIAIYKEKLHSSDAIEKQSIKQSISELKRLMIKIMNTINENKEGIGKLV